MRLYFKALCIIIFLIIVFQSALLSQSPVILYTYAQDAPPKYVVQRESFYGLCHDIIIELNKELKKDAIEIRYKSKMPKSISQIFKALAEGEIQVFIGAAYSEEMEKSAKYIKLPVYGLREMFIIKSNLESKVLSKDVLRVGVVEGTYTSEKVPYISRQREIIAFKNIAEAIEALEREQIDTVFYSSLSLGFYASQDRGKYKPLNAVSEKYYQYIVFSKSVDDKVVKAVEDALKKLLVNGTIDRLIRKYGLEGYVLSGNVVEIIFSDFKPYEWYDENSNEYLGMDVEVVRTVFEKLGFRVVFYTFPWARCLELMKMKMYDGVISAIETEERETFLNYSKEPLSTGYEVLFKLKTTRIDISSTDRIPKDTICGYTDGYTYGDWFWNANFKKIAVPSDELGFQLLSVGRIDLFVCNLLVGKRIANDMKLDIDFFRPAESEVKDLYVAFSKNFHGTYLSKMFEVELKNFKKSEEYNKILMKYGITYDDLSKR
ncbi:MAG: substrate-binding periplasmic protein [Fervidobacterium sp.]|uniref:substrate-binding periplasmic protein n=1 Tax=Fervidobacterium sp. TaxID=1871331 RepID=UPI00404933B1